MDRFFFFAKKKKKETNLFVLTHGVTKWNKTRFEFIRSQSSSPGFVKVVERCSEFVELLLSDAFGVSGQDLVFDFINGPIDGGDQLFPSNTESFHGVLSVSVLEHKWFLDLLVDPLQFFEMRFELVDSFLVFTESRKLVFKGSLKRKKKCKIYLRNIRT